MIEDYSPYIEQLLLNEPWRAGPSDIPSLCHGNLEWDGSEYWVCTDCGRVGRAPLVLHHPAQSPGRVAKNFFRRLLRAMARQLGSQPA